jgi:hypothetical protein
MMIGDEYDDEDPNGLGPAARPDGGKAVLAAILAGASTAAARGGMVAEGSRYAAAGTARVELRVGEGAETRTFVYLRRRFLPDPEQLQTLRVHAVDASERLDLIAARELADPLAFWRLCDANRIQAPLRWTAEPGATLRVPLPAGVSVPRQP